MTPKSVTITRDLPRPQSKAWTQWLDSLSDAHLAVVLEWLRASPYHRLLSPHTCWYRLSGCHDPEERQKRLELIDYWDDYTSRQRTRKARNAPQEAILDGSAQFQDKHPQNTAEAPENAQEAA